MMRQIVDKIYTENAEKFYQSLEKKICMHEPQMIITANPEIIMWAERDINVYDLLVYEKNVLIIADGIGIVKAANVLLNKKIPKIMGIDVVNRILEMANQNKYSLYVYGAKEDTLDKFKNFLKEKYKNIIILGLKNGFDNKPEETAIDIKKKHPDIVLVALGVPKQELFIKNELFPLKRGIYIGVGGSIDAIAGTVKRAPQFFVNHNIEWLYRICREPKRLKRFYNNNIKFAFKCVYKKWKK